MNRGMCVRFLICILFLGICVYSYIDFQNKITEMRILLPKLSAEVRRIEEENTHLIYELEMFESPQNLMKIAQKPEFAHLRFPTIQEVISLKQASPMQDVEEKALQETKTKRTVTFASGANP
jgi:hypothetical protein